ncbi:MAG: iron-sulfur cluster-binding domain-containing protein [Bacteroidota bacterium]
MESATKNERHLVLFAGGSGITPLFSILKSILYHEPRSRVSLLYASRSKADIIFQEELAQLRHRFADRFSLTHALSRETSDLHWGKLDSGKVQQFLRRLPPTSLPTSYWMCGPNSLMDMIQSELQGAGIAEEEIFRERFVADEKMTQRQRNFDGPTRTVEVEFLGETHPIRVPSGISLLEAGIQQGLDLPYSCKQGVCSTCMAQLEQGEVEMANPEALLDFEKEMGKVLVCQCHPKTDDVRIRVS